MKLSFFSAYNSLNPRNNVAMSHNKAAKVMTVLWMVATLISCTNGGERCRCTDPSAACWPTSEEWDAFNVTIEGRLIAPKPTGNPCHDPNYDAATCESIRSNKSNSYMRASNAGSMQYENWEGSGCAADAPRESACAQSLVPARGVRVESISDVQCALCFATRHNLRVVVKSTGHDFLGRSTGAGAFLIWMHNLRNLTLDESRGTVTVTSGVSWGEVYDALEGTNWVVVGGMSLTVSAAGGYAQGGGHGALSPSLGLAADNVLEIHVVTADGALRFANATHEPDLFFALRGGGGGTFGVVTSVTYKLHPNPEFFTGAMMSVTPSNGTAWSRTTQEAILTLWANQTLPLDAARWAGYWSLTPSSFSGIFLAPVTESAARTAFSFIIESLLQIPNVTASFTATTYPTFQAWHRAVYSLIFPATHTDYTGIHVLIGSRIIPLSALNTPERVARAILDAAGGRAVLGHMVIGPGVRNEASNQTSVTPAWRRGVWHLTMGERWSWWDAGESRARNLTRAFVEALQGAFPGSGAYVNEACVGEPEWAESFWGRENYARLVDVKERVDPWGIFVCRQCVGSEAWDEDGNCRLE